MEAEAVNNKSRLLQKNVHPAWVTTTKHTLRISENNIYSSSWRNSDENTLRYSQMHTCHQQSKTQIEAFSTLLGFPSKCGVTCRIDIQAGIEI